MNYNQQDLEAFLIQAQLVNQKVKALAQNKISPQQFDHLERLRQQDRKKRQQAKLRKQQQIEKKKLEGHEGKGIGKDFKNFCYFCRWEYEVETPDCLKCKKKTMTLEQRQKMLEVMVNDYKYKKKNRQQRKHRWEMWKKTQESLWKKTSNNYSKWEYFVSDSEQEPQKEPIVPKNDPNFKALEADLQERKKRKQKDHEQANKLKEKGNKLMKEGNYQQAMHKYTLALQHAKDIKSIYTNRALAFIKLGRFKKAIKDCTNVIEYMEIFEKIGEHKDLTFKAFSRRALARKQIKEYKMALQDITHALKLFPDDKSGLLLKKELEGLSEHAQKVEKLLRQSNLKNNPQKSSDDKPAPQPSEQQEKQDQKPQLDEQSIRRQEKMIAKQLAEQQENENVENKKSPSEEATKPQSQSQTENKNASVKEATQIKQQQNPIEQIKLYVKDLNPENVKNTFELLLKNKDMIAIFIAAKGIQACLNKLLTSQFSNQQALLISLCIDGSGVAEKAIWDFGIQKIHAKISQLLNDSTNQKHHVFQVCQDLFQTLIAVSLCQNYRIKLSNDNKVQIFLEQTYSHLISKKKTNTHLLNLFIIYMSNLLSGSDSGLKNTYFTKQKVVTIIDSFFVVVLDKKTQNRAFLDLKKNVYGLIANFGTHPQHRKTIIQFFNKNGKFKQISAELEQYPRSMANFTQYIESILSVLVNLTFDTSLQLPELMEVLFNRLIKYRKGFSKQISYRSLLVLSRMKFGNPEIGRKWLQIFEEISLEEEPLKNPVEKCNMTQVVKILNLLYTPENGLSLTAEIPPKLFAVLSKYMNDNLVHENLFCNTANLFGVIAMSKLEFKEKVYEQVALGMKRLVEISKDRIGNWRKNAAILIAKCSSNPKVRQAMQKQHAMDVLKTIAHLVSGK